MTKGIFKVALWTQSHTESDYITVKYKIALGLTKGPLFQVYKEITDNTPVISQPAAINGPGPVLSPLAAAKAAAAAAGKDYKIAKLYFPRPCRCTLHQHDDPSLLELTPPAMAIMAFAPRISARTTVLSTIACLAASAASECECGYMSAIGDFQTPFLFTDLIESDFLHLNSVTVDTDWRRQNYSVTPVAGRGPYGMNFSLSNIFSNPLARLDDWASPGVRGPDPGVQLFVDGGIPPNGYVQVAEMDSAREDLLWGSYRAAMKLTLTAGTCSAFFWYFNDSQEIDMEFLSSQFVPENNSFPVNLVLQSAQSVQAGFNAVAAGSYKIANLPFNPTTGYHEYRIDFIPGNVIFYADGQVLASMNSSAVPTSPGHMILTQWSNGNSLWSSGPPVVTTPIAISYVKAYFNSSDPARHAAWATRCIDPTDPSAICAIPDQTTAPNPDGPNGNVTGDTFFFSQLQNATFNQTVFGHNKTKNLGAPLVMRDSLHSTLVLLGLIMGLACLFG